MSEFWAANETVKTYEAKLEAENTKLRERLLIEHSCNRCKQYHGKEPCADVTELEAKVKELEVKLDRHSRLTGFDTEVFEALFGKESGDG